VATIEHTIAVGAPADHIFEYFTDPAKAAAWQSSLLAAQFSPGGPMQLGTRITEVRQLLGRQIQSTVEVTDFDSPRRLGGRVVAGPARWQFCHTLDEQDGTTTVTSRLEGEAGRAFRFAEPLLLRALKTQLESDLSNLKEIVEGNRG
jgi:hypothetical protein